jgi:hypothetical protein
LAEAYGQSFNSIVADNSCFDIGVLRFEALTRHFSFGVKA